MAMMESWHLIVLKTFSRSTTAALQQKHMILITTFVGWGTSAQMYEDNDFIEI